MIADLLPVLHAIYTGASYPGTNLLYELVVGATIAARADAWVRIPAAKYLAVWDISAYSSLTSKKRFFSLSHKLTLTCMPEPLSRAMGFGIIVAIIPCF